MEEAAQESLYTGNVEAGRVLVVDDHAGTRALHRSILAREFAVLTAPSGEDALAVCEQEMPDLVLLDVSMPGLDGYDTCRQLRTLSEVPIIFATAHDTLDEQLRAYDVGGTDIIVKPVSADILLRKARMAIKQFRDRIQLVSDRASLQNIAMNFLTTMGESGRLLAFTRASLTCRSHDTLAEHFVNTAQQFGVQCCVAIHHDSGSVFRAMAGEASALERSILEQVRSTGRLFQFKQRLAINYDHVSVLINNMPIDDEDRAGRLRDNMTSLAEIAEALTENVGMRQESARRAEQMQLALAQSSGALNAFRQKHAQQVSDIRMLFEDFIADLEDIFSWIAADRSEEAQVNRKVQASVTRIFEVLLNSEQFDQEFQQIQNLLAGPGGGNDVELF